MERRIFSVFLVLVCLGCASGGPPEKRRTLPTPLYGQLTNSWCWAASAEMTMAYLGRNVPQCEQANHELKRTDCCVPSGQLPPQPCIHGGYPQYSHWGFSAQTTPFGKALTVAQIQQQVANNTPWAFAWNWTGGGGHVMVGTGWETIEISPAVNLVLMNNPEPWNDVVGKGGSRYWISYDFYVAGPGHTHQQDFYDLEKVSQ